MRLWENAEENQPLIGCLIISLTHSLLIEIRAILIIQEAKYKLVYLTQLFKASLTLRLHSTEQYIHKHYTNYTIQKYMHRKITQCKLHAGMRQYVHNNLLTTRARVLKRTKDVILSGNIIFNSLQGLLRSLNIARLPSVLDPIVMECSEFRAFFWAFSQSLTIPPTEDRGLWLRD